MGTKFNRFSKACYVMPLAPQPVGKLDDAQKWMPGVLFIKQPHQHLVLVRRRSRMIVQA